MRISFGQCVVDTARRQLERAGQRVRLSPKAFDVLEVLVTERPRAVSKHLLLDRVWSRVVVEEQNVKNAVVEIRAALGDDRSAIRTVQRFGYAFSAEALEEPEQADQARYWISRERLSAAPVSAAAHEAYVAARVQMTHFSDDLRPAIESLEQAVRLDPSFAAAWAALAAVHANRAFLGSEEPRHGYELARIAADRALQLQPDSAEALVALGTVRCMADWDWSGAASLLERAIAVDPAAWLARCQYGSLLVISGRHAESIVQFTAMRDLAPLMPESHVTLAWGHYIARSYREALHVLSRVRELFPTYDASFAEALCQSGLRARDAAVKACGRALQSGHQWPRELSYCAYAYGIFGFRSEAMTLVERIHALTGGGTGAEYDLAVAYTGLGECDLAIGWLERAADARSGLVAMIGFDPMFDGLRGDHRFVALLRRMNLPPR